jgi:DNA-binding transcriptional LysR family regulator
MQLLVTQRTVARVQHTVDHGWNGQTRPGRRARLDWNDLKYVRALAASGSVRRAGAELGVHASTVTRHVEQMERRLGVRLFTRTRAGMRITPAGARLLDTHERHLAELAQLERALQEETGAPRGTVVVAIPEALAFAWLVPRLADFAVRAPEVTLELRCGEGKPDPGPGAVDVAILVTDAPPQELVGRPLGPLAWCEYRAKAEARRPGEGAPRTVRIRPDPRVVAAFPVPEGGAAGVRVECSSPLLQMAAAAHGLGTAVLPCVLGDADAALERAGSPPKVVAVDAWLVSHPDSRGIARIQAAATFIQDTWAADRERLEGTFTADGRRT